jgi:chemotaxis protein MotB
MRRRRQRATHANHERWLVSYADFITLLFAFFVVLYASSQVDKKKVGKLALAIQVAFQEMGVFQASTTEVPIDVTEPMPFSTAQAIDNTERTASVALIASRPDGSLSGGAENSDLAQLQAQLETVLAPEISQKGVAMRGEPDGLVISLREAGFFESGSAKMKTASEPAFDRIASMLRAGDYRLRIEGHTDNAPIHNSQFPSNWELSTSRATEIVRLLIVRDGFVPDRLSAAGFAEFHPVSSNRTVEGRGANRRVDIIILSKPVPAAATAGVGDRTPEAQTPTPATAAPGNLLKPSPAAAKGLAVHPALQPAVVRANEGRLPH